MNDELKWEGVNLSTPATYRILVKGELDGRYCDFVGGMHIQKSKDRNSGGITMLCGRVRDQAELSGVLNNLYELRLPILSVEILKTDDPAEA